MVVISFLALAAILLVVGGFVAAIWSMGNHGPTVRFRQEYRQLHRDTAEKERDLHWAHVHRMQELRDTERRGR